MVALPAGAQEVVDDEPPALPGFMNAAPDDSFSGNTDDITIPDDDRDSLPLLPDNDSGPGDAGLSLDTLPEFDFEKTPEELEKEVRDKAFKAALNGLLPMKPEEIRKLLEYYDRTQESVEVPIYPAPKPEIAVETLSLDPGTKPAVIKLAFGHVTTFNTLDITGAPWPIEDMSWAGNFDVMETEAGPGANIVRITPQTEFATGNMSMRLVGLRTPVIIMMETNREKVHYRFDAVIPEFGPMANSPIISTNVGLSAGNIDMAKILEGVPPSGAKRLSVSGIDGRTSAYAMNGRTYLRTPTTLLSPGWSQTVSSADGMKVYEMENAPVVLVSDKGKMVRVKLTEREAQEQ
ncbi:MAG: DotH/IcmK family type IV secretion protein [Alphaproteobacteria bacterium]|nr:DotH/IcmK family type IV secretion protein [Alphaproteobacteria bacterium]MCD8571656.1 DotH/IcmK family type IV secretion protein [Alphaproteobacteria bacterium]